MRQKEIRTVTMALDLATRVNAGAIALGPGGLKQHTPERIAADRAALVTARNDYEAAAAELIIRQDILHGLVLSARDFLFAVRDRFKRFFGNKYSPIWDQTGFVGKIGLGRSIAWVKGVLECLVACYAANPHFESAEQNLTAARAQSLFNDLVAAQTAVDSQRTTVMTLLQIRKTKFVAMKRRIRGVVKELGDIIDPLDGRWLSFGLNIPGAKQTPEVPEGVTATLIGNNALSVKWIKAPRADYYRVYAKINGLDAELVAIGSPADLDFTIEDLPPGATVEIAVSAVNNGGESRRSSVVTVTTA